MGSITSDAELLARSVVDPAAFAAVYERHGQPLRRYVVRRVGAQAGEDLAAEVFVRAFRLRERYRPERDSALPWLFGVANHVIADHRRAEQRRLKALQRLAGTAPQLIEHSDRDLGAEVIRQLRRLSIEDRDAFLLLVWGELSYEETAAALAVPVGTVKSRVARARRTLAAAIAPADRQATVEMRNPTASNTSHV